VAKIAIVFVSDYQQSDYDKVLQKLEIAHDGPFLQPIPPALTGIMDMHLAVQMKNRQWEPTGITTLTICPSEAAAEQMNNLFQRAFIELQLQPPQPPFAFPANKSDLPITKLGKTTVVAIRISESANYLNLAAALRQQKLRGQLYHCGGQVPGGPAVSVDCFRNMPCLITNRHAFEQAGLAENPPFGYPVRIVAQTA